MGRGLRWSYLILKSLRDDGFGSTVKMCVNRIIRKGERQDHVLSSPDVVVHDVLFVNGCPPEQEPHPYRYRVLHQKEQLRAAGYTVSEIDARACTERSVLGAGLTAELGVNVGRVRLYVPYDRLEFAKELYDAYFCGAAEAAEQESGADPE